MNEAAHSRVALAIAALAYAGGVLLASWPLVLHAGDAVVAPAALRHLGGAWGRADLNLLIWILAWTAHALATRPLDLFQANIFHPAPDALAASEHLLGLTPLSAPLFWLSDNAVLTYNVTTLAVVWASAITTFALARAWSGSAAAGFLAGAAFALSPMQTGVFVRLHVSAVHLMPLVLLLAWRAARAPRASTLALLWLVTALQLLSGMYVAYAVVVMVVVLAPSLIVEARRAGRSGVAPLATIAAALPVIVPVGLPYLRARAAAPEPAFSETIASVSQLSPRPLPLLLWVLSSVTWPIALLALVGLLAPDRARRHLRLGLLALAVVGVVLCLGPRLPLVPGTSLPGPYVLAMQLVPGFAAMRAPSRFGVLIALAVVLLAALGAARLVAWARARADAWARARGGASDPPRAPARVASAASLAVLALGLWLLQPRGAPVPLTLAPLPLAAPQMDVYRWLRDHGEGGAVIELPVANTALDGLVVRADTAFMVASTLHWLPLVNGYSGHPPPSAQLVKTLAQRLPDAAALDRLCALAAPRWIVVHLAMLRDDAARWQDGVAALGLEQVTRSGDDVVYRVTRPCERAASATEALSAFGTTTLDGVPVAPLPPQARAAEIRGHVPAELKAGTHVWLWFDVRNASEVRWPGLTAAAHGGVELASRWRDAQAGEIVLHDLRFPLAEDLAPGATVRAQIGAFVPPPGEYVLEVGLAERGAGWPSDGADLLRAPVRVVAPRRHAPAA